jgi:outer membrane protein assembly factor BamE (lipoprotein component of BamABCDE complex)
MKLTKANFFAPLIMTILLAPLGLSWTAEAVVRAQKARPVGNTPTAAVQQPIYSEYRGIRLGMTSEEVRTKLGEPTSKADDQDYYVFSENEAAQIVYDTQHKTKAISVDYMNGVGAPDPKTVVGVDLDASANKLYKLVRYESLGFWVSFNRTAGPVVVVTVTIQKG